jgi:hypothetical protein
MRPNKIGQVAKCQRPLPDENPNQLYIETGIFTANERLVSDIKSLNTDLSLPPVNNLKLEDLEIVEIDTVDFVEYNLTINKVDYSQAKGKVVVLSVQKIILDFSNGVKGPETNVWLTIQDENGTEHTGTLFVN